MELSQILLIAMAVVGALSLMMPVFKKIAQATKTPKDDELLLAAEKGLVVVRALLDALGARSQKEGGITPLNVQKKAKIAKSQVEAKQLHRRLSDLVDKLEGRTVK